MLAKLSHEKLAAAAGLSVSPLRRFESGDEATNDYPKQQIARALVNEGVKILRSRVLPLIEVCATTSALRPDSSHSRGRGFRPKAVVGSV